MNRLTFEFLSVRAVGQVRERMEKECYRGD